MEELALKNQEGRSGKVAVVALSGVAIAASLYFGKKAYAKYKASRTELVVAPVEEESEIMRDILLAKQLVEEANEVARSHGLPTTDDRTAMAVVEEAKIVAKETKDDLVKTILGMTELELDQAIMRGFVPEDEAIQIVEAPPTHSIFQEFVWDWEEVRASRQGKLVYVMHEDEFFEDERGYTQYTLTYYALDNTLADQNDRPIYNVTDVLGVTFEKDFGKGTNQEDVQYIRNEFLKAEYEVIRANQTYSEAILGIDQSMEDYPVKKAPRKSERDWDQE